MQNLLYQTCETKLFPRKLQCFAKDWGMFATEIEESFFLLSRSTINSWMIQNQQLTGCYSSIPILILSCPTDCFILC